MTIYDFCLCCGGFSIFIKQIWVLALPALLFTFYMQAAYLPTGKMSTLEKPAEIRMPILERPTEISTSAHILKHIQRYPDLRFDGVTVMCPLCNVRLVSANLFNWRKHLKSQKHLRNKRLNFPYIRFLCDLVFCFSVCNIPLNVLDRKPFRIFWKRLAPEWPLPSRTSIWCKMSHAKRLVRERIKEELSDNQVWITVNETTDAKGNNTAHVLAKVLHPNGPSPPYLLASKRLQGITPEAIQQLVVEALTTMEVTNSQVLMLVTDSARYMLKAGRLLKAVYENLLHITCVAHILQVVAEEIQKSYPSVDQLMSSTKQIFLKSDKLVENFQADCPDVPLPQEPGWATWLESVTYYHQNFDKLKTFVLELNPCDSPVFAEVQEQFKNQQVEADIRTIYENYAVLRDGIKKLDNASLSLAESLDILDKVETSLRNSKQTVSEQVNKKFHEVLRRSPDYRQLLFINQCLIDKYPVDSLQPFFMFASITSVDVERAFAQNSNIYAKRGRCFLDTNMEALLLIQMYSKSLSMTAPPAAEEF